MGTGLGLPGPARPRPLPAPAVLPPGRRLALAAPLPAHRVRPAGHELAVAVPPLRVRLAGGRRPRRHRQLVRKHARPVRPPHLRRASVPGGLRPCRGGQRPVQELCLRAPGARAYRRGVPRPGPRPSSGLREVPGPRVPAHGRSAAEPAVPAAPAAVVQRGDARSRDVGADGSSHLHVRRRGPAHRSCAGGRGAGAARV
jgi:hypothetical protein